MTNAVEISQASRSQPRRPMSMFKQSVLVSGARVIDKAMSLAIVLVMARHFGEQGMGEFYYYFSLASLFIPLIDVSTGMTLLQRWHERDEHGRRLLMTQLVILKFALRILALALALGGDAISKWGAPNVLAVSAALLPPPDVLGVYVLLPDGSAR